jgi:hypothetical protein
MGYVYILTNEHMPGLVKIGHGHPKQRIKQLSSVTGVPALFRLRGYWEVSEPRKFEKLVHEALHKYRVNSSREFFKIDVRLAKSKVVVSNGERNRSSVGGLHRES